MNDFSPSQEGIMHTFTSRLSVIFLAVAALLATMIAVFPSPAQAAQGMSLDCSIRSTKQASIVNAGVRQAIGCGYTIGASSANGISTVRVGDLPFCVYFGTTLAGCGSPGVSLSVSNRSGQYGRIVPQNPAS